jgi:hypothetical protein
MTPFLVPAERRESNVFDVQNGEVPVRHGMTRAAIREAIYVGKLGAAARVRLEGGEWQLIGGYPEFAAVLRVLGGDLAPMPGTRKLGSWKREDTTDAASAPSRTTLPKTPSATQEPPHTPGVRPRAEPRPPAPVPVAEAKVPTWVVALIAVAIVIVIVIGVSGCIATFDP